MNFIHFTISLKKYTEHETITINALRDIKYIHFVGKYKNIITIMKK